MAFNLRRWNVGFDKLSQLSIARSIPSSATKEKENVSLLQGYKDKIMNCRFNDEDLPVFNINLYHFRLSLTHEANCKSRLQNSKSQLSVSPGRKQANVSID